jgi:hypothetical protein
VRPASEAVRVNCAYQWSEETCAVWNCTCQPRRWLRPVLVAEKPSLIDQPAPAFTFQSPAR